MNSHIDLKLQIPRQSPVRGEVLVGVKGAPSVPDWWRRLLWRGERMFAAGGRVHSVPEDRAATVSRRLRLRGYEPILLCRTLAVKERIAAELPRVIRGWRFLVAGLNDDHIRSLLMHPSREVLLAYLKGELAKTDDQYRQALDSWIENDASCRAFRQKLERGSKENLVHLSDFLLKETADAPDVPFVFEWTIDPERTLEIVLATRTILHKLGGAGGASRLDYGGERLLEFDETGREYLTDAMRDQLERIFEIETNDGAYSDDDRLSGAAPQKLPREMGDRVTNWWQSAANGFSEWMSDAQWALWSVNIAYASAFSGAGARRLTQTHVYEKPIVSPRKEPERWSFDVTWSESNDARFPSGASVQVIVDGDPTAASWEDEGRLLVVEAPRPPGPYRYRFSWDKDMGLLSMEIEYA